jgi:arabinan endo-1,5-alpha-L-arabinosidase
MKYHNLPLLLPLLLVTSTPAQSPTTQPTFSNVSVHDPAVIKVDRTYYVFGSHLAAAKSDDLVHWTLIDSGVKPENKIIHDALTEMKEAFTWGQTTTFWAPVPIRLNDGRFYHYYCVCKGDSARSALGLAVSDSVEGPYRNLGILLRSGMWNQPSEDGAIYDSRIHPNTVDPDVFFDADGKLWMDYGSYSGGIFILELDPDTGKPKPNQGYGKKLLGGPHTRIEAPAILYHPETKYYYLFNSFGGLAPDGGYQIRVSRSRRPDGPYEDPAGHDMRNCRAPDATFFDDKAIEPYGLKLVGNHAWAFPAPSFTPDKDEFIVPPGYVSPGHNSALYDTDLKRAFVFFHTRFPSHGHAHQLRVHELLFTSTGWPLVAPMRYAGPVPSSSVSPDDLPGTYQYLDHGHAISKDIPTSHTLILHPNGTVTAETSLQGTWLLTPPNTLTLTLGDTTYEALVLHQYNPFLREYNLTLTGLSNQGTALWAVATHQK